MIFSNIDQINEDRQKIPYYFALKIHSLRKTKKMKISSKAYFKFVLEQGKILKYSDNYVIDQTRQNITTNYISLKNAPIQLPKEYLQFFIPQYSQNFYQIQLKMYMITNQKVEQIGTANLDFSIYIQIFENQQKSVFSESYSICPEFMIQYKIYVGKQLNQILNLIKESQEENLDIKNAFKKKTKHQIIQIQQNNIQLTEKKDYKQLDMLKKSLNVNKQKLIQSCQKKINSSNKSNKSNSLLSKIQQLIKSRVTKKSPIKTQKVNTSKQLIKDVSQRKCLISEKSFSIILPKIKPHKYGLPKPKSYYHNLNIEREKEKARIEKYLSNNAQNQEKPNYQIAKTLRTVFLLILLTLILFYLLSPAKKNSSKLSGKNSLFNF